MTDVTLTVDGVQVTVPEGTLVIRAAEVAGVQVPRFCDHPLLEPVGACRQCLVDIPDAGNGRGFPKPQASCTIPVAEGMVVVTNNATAVKAQQGIMEFLLVNHPLDCPVCDKGGECPLQNQAMSNGRSETRFDGVKRTFPKPIPVSANILLDRERCVLCARCTRFAEQVPGDPSLVLIERGAKQQVGTAEDRPFSSYFSGNVIQICPVGALTSAEYRFRARPFDLVSTPSVAEHDACGAAIRVDHRRGKVMRRLAGDDPEVNQEWITDKDRFGFRYVVTDRLRYPQVREVPGDRSSDLRPASWLEAFDVAARGVTGRSVGVLPGGRLTLEDARAYAAFADRAGAPVDFRARPHSAEETAFLQSYRPSVTYADLETAGSVVLVGLEPEDEAGTIFLRLRSAVRQHGVKVVSIAPFTTYGASKLSASLVRTPPGEEAAALADLTLGAGDVILAGERLAVSPGALAAAAALADRSGGRLAWVPRRAGEMGAIEAGLLPAAGALDADGIVAAVFAGALAGLVIGGVDPADTSDPAAFRAALDAAQFLVSLEQRPTVVTEHADVVFPVAAAVEKAGTFVTWDGRRRSFGQILSDPKVLTDARILHGILEAGFEAPSGHTSTDDVGGDRPSVEARARASLETAGHFRLATWRLMLDNGTLQQGDKGLAATARPAVARLSDNVFRTFGPTVTITGDRGSWTLPAEPADLADDVVWLPANSFGGGVLADLASPGSTVEVSAG